jgi:hypothetical protein
VIYFVKPIGLAGPIKIGHAKYWDVRGPNLQTWSPLPLECIALIDGDVALERRFHALFQECRSHGEWFHPVPRLLTVIEQIAHGDFDFGSLPEPITLPRCSSPRFRVISREMAQ